MKPIIIDSDKVVFVDVDDTLVMWNGANYKPHQKHIDYVKASKKRGHRIVVWSAGGWEWASTIVESLGLTDYVDLIMSKPAWFLDDKEASHFMPEANRIWMKE